MKTQRGVILVHHPRERLVIGDFAKKIDAPVDCGHY
jgi:hypothetical protein